VRSLDASQIDRFVHDGFVKLENAFSRETAREARTILWRDAGCDPDDPATWTRPVIRLGQYRDAPFIASVSAPRLIDAFDLLAGTGGWVPLESVGTFPLRFPSNEDPGDTGWHVDASFDYDQPDFMQWRVNMFSKGRALLLLLLYSDVGESDAPTRIRCGSHFDVARRLAGAGHAGLTLRELAHGNFSETEHLPEVHATGEAGTAYLCHPFLVHAAQMHRGSRPRFMAQPPLLPGRPLLAEPKGAAFSPVEAAIRAAAVSACGGKAVHKPDP
jgi:hypothetical protein